MIMFAKPRTVALALLLCWASALWAGDAIPGIGVFRWDKNSADAEKIQKLLASSGREAIIIDENDFNGKNLKPVKILIVPKSLYTPRGMWDAVPVHLGLGRHIIFEGYPEKCFAKENGDWKESPAYYPTPGNTHCVADFAEFSFRGLKNNRGRISISKDSSLKSPVEFPSLDLDGVAGLSGRSVNKCQWRLSGTTAPGNLEFRDCLESSPVTIKDEKGNVVGQHTALIRHHCKFFNNSTVIFSDVAAQFSDNPKLSFWASDDLLPKTLKPLIELCLSKLPDEADPAYYSNLFSLKAGIAELKDKYTGMVYAHKDWDFHSANNAMLGIAADKNAGPEKRRNEFFKLEKDALDIFGEFNKWRFNKKDFAVRKKTQMIPAIKRTGGEIDKFIESGKKEISRLELENKARFPSGRKHAAPDGKINVTLSFADYYSTSWFAPPGFIQIENGKLIKSLGIEGCCSYHYLEPGGTRISKGMSFRQLERDNELLKIFDDYCAKTGLNKFTDHELSSYPLSEDLIKKYIPKEKPMIVDFDTGKREYASSFKNVFTSGFGIISEAFDDPEQTKVLEYMAKLVADNEKVSHRSITLEGLNVGGYSDYGFNKYRSFLKERHKNIETLNTKWGSSYSDFPEIEPLCRYPRTKPERANWFDWMDFRSREINAYIRKVTEIYKKYDKKHPLTTCINQFTVMQSLDFYEFNKYLDIAGAHNTPTTRPWYQIGLARKGQFAENSEPKWYAAALPWNRGKEEDFQKCLRYNMLYFGAQGMKDYAPYEWWVGDLPRLAEMDGFLYLGGNELKHFIQWKNLWQKVTGGTAPKDFAATGIYWAFETKTHGRGGPYDKFSNESLFCRTFKVMDAWNNILDAGHLPYEVITRGKVKEEDISHLKVIIVPQSVYMESAVIEKLLDYVKNGGCLILEGACGRWDEYANDNNRLFEAAGVVWTETSEKSLDNGYQAAALATEEGASPAGITFYFADNKSKVLLKYADSSPAALKAPLGKGSIIYAGFSICGDPDAVSDNFEKDSPVLRFLAMFIPGQNKLKLVDCDDPNVRTFTWKGKNDEYYVFAINHSDTWKNAELKFSGDVKEITDIESGVAVNRKNDADKTISNIRLFPAGGRVLGFSDGGEK